MLARAIKEGRMVDDVRIEPNFDEDDDHVVLVLGAIDAASAKFRRPDSCPTPSPNSTAPRHDTGIMPLIPGSRFSTTSNRG